MEAQSGKPDRHKFTDNDAGDQKAADHADDVDPINPPPNQAIRRGTE
jgi:hypothetical protein